MNTRIDFLNKKKKKKMQLFYIIYICKDVHRHRRISVYMRKNGQGYSRKFYEYDRFIGSYVGQCEFFSVIHSGNSSFSLCNVVIILDIFTQHAHFCVQQPISYLGIQKLLISNWLRFHSPTFDRNNFTIYILVLFLS